MILNKLSHLEPSKANSKSKKKSTKSKSIAAPSEDGPKPGVEID